MHRPRVLAAQAGIEPIRRSLGEGDEVAGLDLRVAVDESDIRRLSGRERNEGHVDRGVSGRADGDCPPYASSPAALRSTGVNWPGTPVNSPEAKTYANAAPSNLLSTVASLAFGYQLMSCVRSAKVPAGSMSCVYSESAGSPGGS